MVNARYQTPRTLSLRKEFSHTHLKNVECFRGLSVSFLEALIDALDIELFSAGDDILKEGTVGSTMIFLLHGSVDVSKRGQIVATLEGGSLFGEMACLGLNAKRTCTVTAKEFCDCRCISDWHFKNLLTRFPEAKAHFEAIAYQRQEELKEKHLQDETQARMERTRRRSLKFQVDIVSGKRHGEIVALHEKRILSARDVRNSDERDASKEKYAETRAKLLAAGWALDDNGQIANAGQTRRRHSRTDVDCSASCKDDAANQDITQGAHDSIIEHHRCQRPVVPLGVAKPGASFRRGRLLKEEARFPSAETPATSVPSSRSLSIDSTAVWDASCEDFGLPSIDAARRPSALKEAMEAANTLLRVRLVRTQDQRERGTSKESRASTSSAY